MFEKLFKNSILITTDRLVLRPVLHGDAQDLYEIFSDRQVMKYYDLLPFESLERAKEQIEFFALVRVSGVDKTGSTPFSTVRHERKLTDAQYLAADVAQRQVRFALGVFKHA